jgi:hypothetical protein
VLNQDGLVDWSKVFYEDSQSVTKRTIHKMPHSAIEFIIKRLQITNVVVQSQLVMMKTNESITQ